jgi:hypothetical protein
MTTDHDPPHVLRASLDQLTQYRDYCVVARDPDRQRPTVVRAGHVVWVRQDDVDVWLSAGTAARFWNYERFLRRNPN